MTERQEHLLRIMADPTNVRPQLSPLDQAAIRVAIAERAKLLAACEATEDWLAETMRDEDDLAEDAQEILATVRAALAAAKGAS